MSVSAGHPERPRLEAAHVSKSFTGPGGRPTLALQDVSLRLGDGEFVCLLGPSGCGKSTVLNLLAGFEQPTRGTVHFDGRRVTAPGPERGVVFQQPLLFPWLSVLDNVGFGARMAGVARSGYEADARRYLDLVGLRGFDRHMPYQLSGGMRQRVALARAWLPQPRVLLMDEPFGALDAQTRLMMQELLSSLWQELGTTVLFITHDVEEALTLADRVLVMSARPGRIVEEVDVSFARPRRLEDLLVDGHFGTLKRHILGLVQREARRSMAIESVA